MVTVEDIHSFQSSKDIEFHMISHTRRKSVCFILKLNLLSKVPQKLTAHIYNAFDLLALVCSRIGSVRYSGQMSSNTIKALQLPIPDYGFNLIHSIRLIVNVILLRADFSFSA